MFRIKGSAALALAFGLAVAACAGPGSTPSSTSAGGDASEPSGSGDVAVGEHVQAIQDKGFILIGSSPDFPPYEFIDDNGEFAGFDVDLMQEIADRMGVELQWQDMPFDVTITTLQAGDVDISVSTHQKTPDNSEQVDFTIEYAPATTVFLKRNDRPDIVLNEIEDVAAYKVAVQTGGTNEKWLQDNLVATGLMPAENVLTYERHDAQLQDLLNGRVDLMTSEGNTGKFVMEDNPVEFALITTKMNQSNYVIAVPKGWDDLRELFNQYITQMLEDGTIDELEDKWELVEPPPDA
jgi:polar amino acid transport system substrate-binding protein